ncbi:MAG: hypothetical protein GXO75_01855 [Calditrichaeota bacterium]|nr:hypothetical protein [Calditrichota bacterium]
MSVFHKIKTMDGFHLRGAGYILIGVIGIVVESVLFKPLRPVVVLLWLAVIGIGVAVIFTLKEDKR